MCIVKIYDAAAAVGTGCVTLLVAPPLRVETRAETGKALRALLVEE